MKKIDTLFQRDFSNKECPARNEVTPGCEWVLAGEGVATRKYDGTCCMIRDGLLYKRYNLKEGRPMPDGYEPAEGRRAENGRGLGWVPVGDGPEDALHRKGLENSLEVNGFDPLPDGTYELIGPKIQRNPEGFGDHYLEKHGSLELPLAPRDYDGLKAYLADFPFEGIVWHHPDGRMAKVKRSDFGYNTTSYHVEVYGFGGYGVMMEGFDLEAKDREVAQRMARKRVEAEGIDLSLVHLSIGRKRGVLSEPGAMRLVDWD